ncbi:hypothetical protein TREES_T100000683 [Tupaia chinensis]|uniref:Uncharacterized protein n=1 Tax=Tupaia chinensis TaxID=246437 RepID=L9KKA2_TUPCH|nr:hypothetical protein TREES_T100000683 [Tupaia chinensis]
MERSTVREPAGQRLGSVWDCAVPSPVPLSVALPFLGGAGTSEKSHRVVCVWSICRHDCVEEIQVAVPAGGAAGSVRGAPHCSEGIEELLQTQTRARFTGSVYKPSFGRRRQLWLR